MQRVLMTASHIHKSIDILSDMNRRLLFNWYSNITVQVKWGNVLSNKIEVKKGTRQGGLTSTF